MSPDKTSENQDSSQNGPTKETQERKKSIVSQGRKRSEAKRSDVPQKNLQKYNIKLNSVVMKDALNTKEKEDKPDYKDKRRISFAKEPPPTKIFHGAQEKHGAGSKAEEPMPRASRRRQSTLADLGNFRMPQAPLPSSTNSDGKMTKLTWCDELTPQEIAMFRQVFEFLDRDGGGSLDANELFSVMKELEIDVSLKEIKFVLKDLDKDGNGEIDFDEFMYAMFETDRYLDQLYADPKTVAEARSRGGYGRRQTLFFTAVTRFAIKNSLGDIERYYAAKIRHAPHVISYYTAGARLIGLNDRQLEQQMRQMQKAAKNTSSPYAQPQPFYVVSNAFRKQKMKQRAKQRDTLIAPPGESQPGSTVSSHKAHAQTTKQLSMATDNDRRTGIAPNSKHMDLLKTLQEMAEKGGNVVANIPDIKKLSKLEIANKNSKFRNRFLNYLFNDTKPLYIESAAQRQREILVGPRIRKKVDTFLQRKHTSKARGWKTVRAEPGIMPLPVIKVKASKKPFTIDDVTVIRKRVSQAMNKYYTELKKASVKSSQEHWAEMYSEDISSDRLRELFCDVYMTYAPQKVDDVFVRCPWIPDPRYGSHQAGKRITYLPSVRSNQTASPAACYSPSQRPQLPICPFTAGYCFSPRDLGILPDRDTPSPTLKPLYRPTSARPESQ